MLNMIIDYVETLKEEEELENILIDILNLESYSEIIPPQKGIRQFGSDVSCTKNNEKYYFVIKQGDFNRHNWDDGNNAIRQSMNQLIDVLITEPIQEKYSKINIIVCFNGIFKQEVEQEWNGFLTSNEKRNNISFKRWDKYDLAQKINSHLSQNDFISSSLRSDVRKTLYFVDEVDNDLKNYKSLFSQLLKTSFECMKNKKMYKKNTIMLMFIVSLCIKNAQKSKNNRIAIKMAEYAIITYWNKMIEENRFEKNLECETLSYFYSLYEKSSKKYILSISTIAVDSFQTFFASNPLELKILIYESIGFIATYNLSKLLTYIPESKKKELYTEVDNNIGLITRLITNNAAFYYPPYDLNSIEIDILLLLLTIRGHTEVAINLLTDISTCIAVSIAKKQIYPVEYENFEKALLLSYNKTKPDFIATSLLATLYEWLLYYKLDKQFTGVRDMISKNNPDLTYNFWSIENDDESNYFIKKDYYFGESITYKGIKKDNIENISEKIAKPKKLNSIAYSCMDLLLISARHNRKPVLKHLIMDLLDLKSTNN